MIVVLFHVVSRLADLHCLVVVKSLIINSFALVSCKMCSTHLILLLVFLHFLPIFIVFKFLTYCFFCLFLRMVFVIFLQGDCYSSQFGIIWTNIISSFNAFACCLTFLMFLHLSLTYLFSMNYKTYRNINTKLLELCFVLGFHKILL